MSTITLTIRDFKYIRNKTVIFKVGNVILLKGVSGSGKTTLLNSIAWCLFEFGNIGIAPFSMKKPKTQVSLSFSSGIFGPYEVKITRSKNPNQIIFERNDKIFNGEEAQNKINEIFGTSEMWSCSSYLEQKMSNEFLNMSNNDKIEFLHSLVFTDNKYVSIGKEVKEEINQKILEYKINYAKYEVKQEQWNSETENYEITDIIPESEIQNQRNKINQLEYCVETIRRELIEKSINLDRVNKLISSYNLFNNELNKLVIPEKKLSLIYDSKILEELNNKFQQIVEIRTKICYLIFYDDKLYFDNEYLVNNIQFNKIYEQGVKLSNKLMIDFKHDSFVNKYNELEDIIQSQEYLKIDEEQKKLNKILNELQIVKLKEIKELNIFVPINIEEPDFKLQETKINILQDKLNRLKEKYNIIQIQMSDLTCPNCNVCLELINGNKLKLVSMKSNEESKIEIERLSLEMKNIQDQILKIRNEQKIEKDNYHLLKTNEMMRKKDHERKTMQINYENQASEKFNNDLKMKIEKNIIDLNIINQKINENNKKEFKNKIIFSDSEIIQIKYLQNEIVQWLSLEKDKCHNYYQKLNYSIEQVQSQIEYQKYNDKIKSLTIEINDKYQFNNFSEIPQLLEALKFEIHKYKEAIGFQTNLKNKIETLKQEIDSIEIPNVTEEDISLQMIFLERAKNDLKMSLFNNEKYDSGMKLYSDKCTLEEQRNEIREFEKYKILVTKTQNDLFMKKIDEINYNINSICNELFHGELFANIRLYKQVKNQKSEKSQINFEINHNGNIIPGIKNLSGGEQDRFSMAMTLAIHMLSPSPILIFDENIASIDIDLKKKVIELLKSLCSNKIIITVIHDCNEGYFNDVVPF